MRNLTCLEVAHISGGEVHTHVVIPTEPLNRENFPGGMTAFGMVTGFVVGGVIGIIVPDSTIGKVVGGVGLAFGGMMATGYAFKSLANGLIYCYDTILNN